MHALFMTEAFTVQPSGALWRRKKIINNNDKYFA